MNNKILGWNHLRRNISKAEKIIIRSLCLKNLINPTTHQMLQGETICERHVY